MSQATVAVGQVLAPALPSEPPSASCATAVSAVADAGWPTSLDVGDSMMLVTPQPYEIIVSPTFEKVGHPPCPTLLRCEFLESVC